MKRIIFNLLISFFVIFSLKGQEFNKSNIYGRWFMIDKKTDINTDTMIFKRDRIDSTFNEWSFDKNDTLSISSGYIKYFDKDHQFFLCSAFGRYKFSIGDTANKLVNLKIIKDRYTDIYSILLLDNDNLVLKKDKSYEETQLKKANKKAKYYFTHADYDSTVFDMDTLVLSLKRINTEFPRIEFYPDSIFCFFYNVELHKISDIEKGVMTTVEKSDRMNGSWNTNDIQKSISLKLNNNRIANYLIINKEDLIFFIKQE